MHIVSCWMFARLQQDISRACSMGVCPKFANVHGALRAAKLKELASFLDGRLTLLGSGPEGPRPEIRSMGPKPW